MTDFARAQCPACGQYVYEQRDEAERPSAPHPSTQIGKP